MSHPYVESTFLQARFVLCEVRIALAKAKAARRGASLYSLPGGNASFAERERRSAEYWQRKAEDLFAGAMQYRRDAKAARAHFAAMAQAAE